MDLDRLLSKPCLRWSWTWSCRRGSLGRSTWWCWKVLGADGIAERKENAENIIGAHYLVIGGVADEVVLTSGVEVGDLWTNFGFVALAAAAAKGREGSAECSIRVTSGR